MAESITRRERPLKIKQQESITPVNLEKLGSHFDNEIEKLYQLLGKEGTINNESVAAVVFVPGGGSGSPPPPAFVAFLNLGDTPSSYNVEGIMPSINGLKNALEFSGLGVIKNSIPAVESFTIESGYQMQVADKLTIEGELIIEGKLVVF